MRLRAVIPLLLLVPLVAAHAQESIVKAEELIRLQSVPLSRPASFELQHPPEQIDYLAWLTLRALDSSNSWNPRNRAWNLYRVNIRHSLEQSLRQRWQSSAGVIRSLSQNPDTALAKFYADGLSAAELDEALAFFRGEAGKKYLAYLRELKRVYYNGQIELDRIGFDPDYGAPGDSLAMRRTAWLAKHKVSLEVVPPGYSFHVRSAQALLPGAKTENIVFPLLVGAPPGSGSLQRLDAALAGAERDAVARFLESPVSEKEKRARQAWAAAIAKSRDVAPLLLSDMRSVLDVILQWKKVRADPRALPRSIVEIDPASVEVREAYANVDLQAAEMPATLRTCVPGASDQTARSLTQGVNGRSYKEVTTVVSFSEGRNLFVARQGLGVCIPTTIPGYPVPATSSFAGTLRFIGMDEGEEKSWHRSIAQEIAAAGASESLVVLPNGNAYEVSYAVKAQAPQTLIYSHRILFAGTYETRRYRTVRQAPGFRSLESLGTLGAASDVVRYEKSLFTTPEDLRRDAERRARHEKS